MAFAVLAKRGKKGSFHPERTGLTRDLDFFIVAFGFATIALYIPHTQAAIRAVIGFCMVLI